MYRRVMNVASLCEGVWAHRSAVACRPLAQHQRVGGVRESPRRCRGRRLAALYRASADPRAAQPASAPSASNGEHVGQL